MGSADQVWSVGMLSGESDGGTSDQDNGDRYRSDHDETPWLPLLLGLEIETHYGLSPTGGS